MIRILTISGPSGSGKTALALKLLGDRKHPFRMVVSHTTRKPRPTDLKGESRYISRLWFRIIRFLGVFLWDVQVRGEFYGTKRASVRKALRERSKISLMILVPWCLSILKSFVPAGRILHVFITTSPERIRERLLRKGVTEVDIERRVKDGVDWQKEMVKSGVPYAHFINDGSIEELAEKVKMFIGFRIDDPDET